MSKSILASVFLLSASVPAMAGEWSGPYIGASLGYSWGDAGTKTNIKDWCTPGDTTCIAKYVGPFDYNPSGIFGSGQAGYNLQFDRVVLGVEGDLGYLNLEGDRTSASSNPIYHQNETLSGGLYGDITGRAGVLVTPALLLYGKGGAALFDGSAEQQTTKPGYISHDTGTFTGWVAGGGAEYLLTQNVSLKIEFLHFDFGSQGGDQTSVADDPIGHVYKNTTSLDANSIKAGLNLHF